jgi:hypothetical protein
MCTCDLPTIYIYIYCLLTVYLFDFSAIVQRKLHQKQLLMMTLRKGYGNSQKKWSVYIMKNSVGKIA